MNQRPHPRAPVNNATLERLSSITERVQARPAVAACRKRLRPKEAYRWKATTIVETVKEEVATPKALKKALEHENAGAGGKLALEAVERDGWAAEVNQLAVPKLVEQVALNAWKEQDGNRICLHLRRASGISIPPARSKSWPKRSACCTVHRLN